MKLHLPSVRSVPWRGLPVLIVALVAGAGLSHADIVYADCGAASPTPPHYSTVQAALAALPNPVAPDNAQNVVYITGTCAESVLVSGFVNLTIYAQTAGATLTPGNIPGVGPYALMIEKSDKINVNTIYQPVLTFDGTTMPYSGPALVYVYESTRVTFANCIFQNNTGGEGLRIDNSRDVFVTVSTLQNNATSGLTVNGPSTVDFGNWNGPPYAATTVQNNGAANTGAAGIAVFGGATLMLAPGANVTGNAYDGVSVGANSYLIACCESTPASASGPGPGVVQITGNGGNGINATGSSLLYLYAAMISGNKSSGISLDHSSATLWDDTVENNGIAGQPTQSNGILANYASSVGVMKSSVTGNLGPGVQAMGGSALMFCCDGVTISGNTGDGVLLQMNSNAAFWGSSTITGNTPADLVCTSGAVAVSAKGVDPGLGKIQCSGYTVLGPGGNPNKPPKPPKPPKH